MQKIPNGTEWAVEDGVKIITPWAPKQNVVIWTEKQSMIVGDAMTPPVKYGLSLEKHQKKNQIRITISMSSKNAVGKIITPWIPVGVFESVAMWRDFLTTRAQAYAHKIRQDGIHGLMLEFSEYGYPRIDFSRREPDVPN